MRRLALLACAVLAAGCGAETPPEPRARALPVARVAVEVAALRAVDEVVEAVGTVRSWRQSVLAARITAAVLAVHAREGDRVRRGQLLVELDDRDVQAQLRRAEAAAREAQSALEETERAIEAAARAVEAADAQLALTRVTAERYRTLVERELIAPQTYDEVAARHRAALAGAARAREVKASYLARRQMALERIAHAEAEVVSARVTAGYARLHAPVDAIVVARTVEVGNLATPGTPLFTLDEERYRLEATVPESDVQRLARGRPATVAVEALGRSLAGPVSAIVPAADPASRTFTVKVDLPDAPGLRTGLWGRARFPVGRRQALLVPQAAVSLRGQLEAVFVVDDGNVARLRLVKLGKAYGERVEVLAGLAPGERLVVRGVDGLVDGQALEIRG